MADPFSFPDPFDRLNLLPRHRQTAAYPPLDDADTDTIVNKLTRGTLSGLGYVGSTLDKLTGARAVRGALAGKPRELLSVLPGSDVLGVTHEEDTTHGEDLLRQIGYDPSQGNWAERNLVGPAVELGLDPATYFGGVGALTRAGKLAAKTGQGTRGLLAGVRAGERSLHPLVAATERVIPGSQARAADLAELAGRGVKAANVGVRKRVPGVAPVEDAAAKAADWLNTKRLSLFDKPSGFVPEKEIQAEHRGIKHPAEIAAEQEARRHTVELHQEREGFSKAFGLDPQAMDRWLNRYRVSVPTEGAIIGPLKPGSETALRALGDQLIDIGWYEPEAIERGVGAPFSELVDTAEQYGMRRKLSPPKGGRIAEAFANAFGGKKRLLPTTHGSGIRRRMDLKNWEGGESAMEELMTTELAGKQPTLSKQEIVNRLVQDQLERYHQARTLPWRNIAPGPLAPADLTTIRGRAREMQRWLKTLPPENIEGAIPGAPRRPFWNPDPIALAVGRKQLARGAEGSARTIFSVIGKHAVPAGAPGTTSIPEVLAHAKLTSPQALEHTLGALGYDVQAELAQAAAALPAGATLDPAHVMRSLLEQHALPARLDRGATRLLNRWQVPEEVQPWLHLLDLLQNAFKTGTYTLWPGSLIRNIGSGIEENTLMSGMGPVSPHYGVAQQALAGAPQHQDLLRRAYIQGVVGRPQGEIAERVGLQAPLVSSQNPLAPREGVGEILGQILASLRAKGWRGLGDLGQVGRALGTKAEDNLRLAEFSHLVGQGWSDVEAAKRVAQTHFDYNDLAPFESAVMKRLVPFYTYPRKNLPKQLARAVQSPALTGGPIRFSGMLQDEPGEGYVPDYLRSGLALPLGESAPGTGRYLSALGLPMEEAFGRLKIGQNLPETIAKTAESYLGTLRPGIRMPLEVATGRQFFTGRDLQDLHIGNVEGLLTGGNETAGRVLSELGGATPASRAISTLNRVVDTRKYAGSPASIAVAELVPLLSGARITDVDLEKWRAIDARNQLQRELQASPHIRESKDYFADRTARAAGQVTPGEAIMLQAYAALKQRAREAAERQKRVGVRISGG